MNRAFQLIFVLVFGAYVGMSSASDKQPCDSPCGIPIAWSDFNAFELRMAVSGQGGGSFWRGQFDKESHDIQIEAEISDGKTTARGKILMVGGRVMAVHGPVAEEGYEIDAVDSPILGNQLVLRLLAKVLPNGPKDIRGVQQIDFIEEKDGLKVATPSAEGLFQRHGTCGAMLTLSTPILSSTS